MIIKSLENFCESLRSKMSMKKIARLASTVKTSFTRYNEMNDGPNAVLVKATTTSYRLTVNILEVKSLNHKSNEVKSPLFKLKVEDVSKRSDQVEGQVESDGTLKVNQSFSFEIRDPMSADLSIKIQSKGVLGWNTIGVSRIISVKDFLDKENDSDGDGDKWHDIYSTDGRKQLEGKIRLHIVGGIAEPEQEIQVFVGTWNVGNSRPPQDLSPWLPRDASYELIAIGTQECDYQPRAPHTDCGKDWLETCKAYLGKRYKVVHAVSRGQMRLIVFVRDDSEKAISSVDSGSEATGVGHVIANKGGVCISLKFWDTGLCFVNSHFAAHDGHCETRNANYKEIVGEMRAGLRNVDILNQFNHVFWMGDLNYRLDFADSEEKPMTPRREFWHKQVHQILHGDYKELLQYDELSRERSASRVFHGFSEGDINFPPTFKMHKDSTNTYNQKRMPAWCDRVLWRSLEGSELKILSYTHCPTISTSDHKPVSATFTLTTHALPFSNSIDLIGRETKRWHLRFTSLKASNLRASDMNGYSDPYLLFTGPNLIQEFRSKVKYQNLNPAWTPDEELPVVVLSNFPLKRLEHEHLTIQVLDYDYASADDTLGFTAIPLCPIVTAFKKGVFEPCNFKVEVLRSGLPAGTLEGSMILTWERVAAKEKSKFRISAMITKKIGFQCMSELNKQK